MEPDRAIADLESFLAERGAPLLRTAVLLAGGRDAGPAGARPAAGVIVEESPAGIREERR